MKEYIIDLYKKGGGTPSKVRLFAGNAAAALKVAKNMHPDYRTGGIKEL